MKKEITEIDIIKLQNQYETLKTNIIEIKEQQKISFAEHASMRKEMEEMKIEAVNIRNLIELLKNDFAPIRRIFNIIVGLVVTTLVAGILALIINR